MTHFTINHETYHIDEWDIGCWIWTSTGYECEGYFPTKAEAIADAKRHAAELEAQAEAEAEEAEEDEKYGTFEQQVREHWKATRL